MDDVILLSSDEDEKTSPQSSGFPSPLKCSPKWDDFDYGMSDGDTCFSPSTHSNNTNNPRPGGSETYSAGTVKDRKLAPWETAVRKAHSLSDSDSADQETPVSTKKAYNKPPDSDDDLPEITFISSPTVPRTPEQDEYVSGSQSYSPLTKKLLFKDNDEEYDETEKPPAPRPKARGRGRAVDPAAKEEQQRRKLEIQEEKQRRKQKLQEERDRKKKEAALAKAQRQARTELNRAVKPGEWQKLVKLILDSSLLTHDFGGDLLTALRSADLEYRIEESVVPNSVSFEREIREIRVEQDKVIRDTRRQKEPQLIVVWLWDQLVQLVHDGTLRQTVEEILALVPGSVLTIVIYGLEEYFRFQKTQKRRDVRADVLGSAGQRPKGNKASFHSAPQVSRGDVEYALVELQIFLNVCHRSISNKDDLGNIGCQFAKSIAQADAKRGKENQHADLEWFASADSQDCVPVDKDGNGLLRLWQQQLCQFPLAGIDTSEAIASVYPSPLALVKAYEECSSMKEAEQLLQDIPVRRGPGPLSTTRRIGPQLSKKIHTYFTTSNGDLQISQE